MGTKGYRHRVRGHHYRCTPLCVVRVVVWCGTIYTFQVHCGLSIYYKHTVFPYFVKIPWLLSYHWGGRSEVISSRGTLYWGKHTDGPRQQGTSIARKKNSCGAFSKLRGANPFAEQLHASAFTQTPKCTQREIVLSTHLKANEQVLYASADVLLAVVPGGRDVAQMHQAPQNHTCIPQYISTPLGHCYWCTYCF